MRTINVYKARQFVHKPVESVTIVIDEVLPEVCYEGLDAWRVKAKTEAIKLCDALCAALPQGVIDALLVELLDRTRSLFVVPMETPKQIERSHELDCDCLSCRLRDHL